jgi:exopolysaccharide biosynthesis polyprenyl glycosylphosphotransferase
LVAVDVLAASGAAMAIYQWRVRGLSTNLDSSVLRNVATVTMPLIWVIVLALHRGYDRRAVEAPSRSWRRTVQAGFTLAAVVSSACLALRYTSLIDYVVIGIPSATALTIVARHMTTLWLRSHGTGRRLGLVVGHATPVAGLVAALRRTRDQDLRVVATCLADADQTTPDQLAALSIPVYGDLSDIRGTALAAGCDFVIALPSPELDTPQLRQLAWSLHDVGVELLVAPALSDVATERVAVQPAGGSLLLHVRAPMLTGPQRVLKGLLDRVTAGALLLVLSPFMIGTAVLVRLTSPGPALFHQRRVGRNGREFTCLKFRTMTVDAEARRAELVHLNERSDGLLFKMRNDPRITRIGGVLRKYSIDELPQLINVVAGQMSLVGPRPPLPQEVAAYDDALRRRLLVKPGLTGLWQVSGRSELSWSESVRLDLSYVDNWSPALDARILLRTVSAVVRGTGAY